MGTSDLRKAAIVLLSLPRKLADELLSRLELGQAAAVGEEMARLGRLDPDEQAAAIRAFSTAADNESHDPTPKQPFQFLHNTKPKALAGLLADERPPTIALVLSLLPVELAADTLDVLPPERQTSIVRCLSTMERPCADVVCDVETAIQRRLSGDDGSGVSGIANVVKMLGAMRPAGERRLLGELAQTDPDLWGKIRRKMFGPDVAALAQNDAADAA